MSFIKNHPTPPNLKLWLSNEINICEFKHHIDDVLKKQQILYEAHKFCDVILIAGISGTKVPVHKIVLSASSDYFLAMFGGAMKESDADEVTIEQVSGTTLKALVDFMYSGCIELCNETVEEILRLADLLRLNAVVDACCNYMSQQLDLTNCLGVALLAEQHGYIQLYEESFGLACRNFERMCTVEEFYELSEEQLSKFLSSDDICVSSEEKVLKSLVAWIDHKPTRDRSIWRLLSHVRFTLLEPRCILEHKNSVCRSLECEQLITKWLDWHKKPSAKETKRRRTSEKLALLSNNGLTRGPLKLQTYDAVTNEWRCVDLPHPTSPIISLYNCIHINNKLIIIGSVHEDYFMSKDLECLDLQTMKWSRLPPMRVARSHCGMVELNGQLYVVGGAFPAKWSLAKWSTPVEKYDFNTCEWQIVAPAPKKMSMVAVIDGFMYAMGEETSDLNRYDPQKNKWSKRACRLENTSLFGMAAMSRYIYTLGGYRNNNSRDRYSTTVERYDSTTNTWTVVCSLKIPRLKIKCIAFGNRLIACGGHDGNRNANIIEEYNPESDKWKYLAPMPYFRNFITCPVLLN